MTKFVVVVLWLLTIGLSCATSRAEGSPADLSGKWESDSGAIYSFSQIDQNISAVYDLPDDEQLASGIKPGDIAFSGTVIGNILSGVFYQRFSSDETPACAANFYHPTHLYLTVSDDGAEMEGELLRTHVDDSCKAYRRFFQHLIIKREQTGPSGPADSARSSLD
ncbi:MULTISPECIES: hypothetical protein [Bradyrhizobium]|uniref:hypothetical protein n=1 Tax=Bradyrhizobium elkanii TaxID=29448 RepID=UPI0012BC249B|nr:hypothetical protein [Bradyrhizobium elkanii]